MLGLLVVWVSFAFVGFVQDVNALSAPTPDNETSKLADGLVVVTGGPDRIEVALDLLTDGAADRLLISGVHTGTGVAALVRRTQADPALFDCCIDLDRNAMDTAGNAREAAAWVDTHGFQSLLVVTSAYHIPRTLSEMRHLLPEVDLVAFPIGPAGAMGPEGQASEARSDGLPDRFSDNVSWPLRLLAREFTKLQLARLRHLVEPSG
ncbi:MAG: YdcF family protein [Pseudomonadota bacterium]